MSGQVWFITGASRGLGLEIARAALNRGDSVIAAARNPQDVERALGQRDTLFPVALNVTNAQQAQAATDAALARFGQIDVLVNNAGRGLVGAIEEASAEEVRDIFAINVEGVLTVTRTVLPSMRARRSGHVMNMSSVGGFRATSGWGVYSATKFALEALSEAMNGELSPLGIKVTIIEPGPFRTDFLDSSSLVHAAHRIDDYAATAGGARNWATSTNQAQAGDPVKAADAILSIAGAPHPPLRLQLGKSCVAAIEAKLKQVGEELAKWREVAEGADFDSPKQASA